MRFQVAKCDLDSALQVVTPSLDTKSGGTLTAHFVFRRTGTETDGYGVEVVAIAGKVFASCPVKVVVEDPGDKGVFTIEGRRLKEWLQFVSDAALTFELDGVTVVAKAPRGSQTFQSLTPDNRYQWRGTLKESKVTATLPAPRLAAALTHSAKFASTKENDQPDLCICEIKDGVLYSTDKKAVTLIRVAGMEGSNLRVHASDVKCFTAFLGECGTGDVDVLEHDRMLFIRRGDGAIFGESRFQGVFPSLTISLDDVDQYVWTISKAEVLSAVGFIKSGVASEDNRLHMALGKDDDVLLSMMSTTGLRTELSIPAGAMESVDKAPALPAAGFEMDHSCLTKVLNSQTADDVPFGINVKGGRGYIRFVSDRDDDRYLTIMAWLK